MNVNCYNARRSPKEHTMKIQVECPECGKTLLVPAEAVGKQARCPGCRHIFDVVDPSEESLYDESIPSETVSHWLNQELQQEDEEREQRFQEATEKNRKVDEERERRKQAQTTTQKKLQEELSRKAPAAEPEKTPETRARENQARLREMIEAGGEKQAPGEEEAPSEEEAPAPAQEAEATEPESLEITGPSGAKVSREARIQTDGRYPDNLHVTGPIPRLVVCDVQRNGVRMAFDSIWLEHTGFRLSMPFQCIYTGHTDRTNLFIRSLAFIDRSSAKVRHPSELFTGFGQPMLESLTRREVLSMLGRFEAMPSPFDATVPYFVSSEMSRHYVECTTERREDGGITCFVTIPNLQYALTWLSRVNGTIGTEYELLRQDVRHFASDAWGRLSSRAQELLEGWVRFEAQERFLLYLNDAEFSRKDAGLAGIVVTDQRLIYRKYHRQGSVRLDEEGTLVAKADEDFVALTLKTPEGTTKIGKLRFEDVSRLAEMIRPATGLRMETAA